MSREKKTEQNKESSNVAGDSSRRGFLKNSSLLVGGAVAGSAALNTLPIARAAHAEGSDMIKVGLVGCGGRGTGAAIQALNTEGKVNLVALGDAFESRMQQAVRAIKGKHPDKIDSEKVSRFVGMDAYKGVLASDCDLVILATPPGFRPLQFEAAVEAGKHVFMEKPVATDAPGVRRVLAANEKAKKKNLAVQVGLQRHHENSYKETIKRLHDGEIGDILLARAYWNNDGVWVKARDPKWTELEYQIQNWYYFNWICGDHIVEQHIHNLDVINWLMKGYPKEAQGQGGRQVRDGIDFGQIYDHHFVEFTYGSGTKLLSQCRHVPETWSSVSEFAHGTKGWCDISGATIYDNNNKVVWKYDGRQDGWQEEHHDLFAALRKGEVPNEGDYGAYSTLTAIMGRMATYSGKKLSWEECLNSNLSLANVDAMNDLAGEPPLKPDENMRYFIPKPGSENLKKIL
jgi:predicted dehydrogenase